MKKTSVFYDSEFYSLLERQGSVKKIYDRMERETDYKKVNKRRDEIYYILSSQLNEEQRKLLSELDDLIGSELSDMQISAYIQGVKDTMKNPLGEKLKRVK